MGLPINKSRAIEISGVECRWLISGEKKDTWTIHDIIVQSNFGGKLIIKVVQEIYGMYWLYTEDGVKICVNGISQNWIKRLADIGVNKGWRPNENKSFTILFSQEENKWVLQ